MRARFAVALLAAVGSQILVDAGHAQFFDERAEMLSGGAPLGRFFNFFGGSSDVTRTRVRYGDEHSPGTIIIDTAERKLYLVEDGGTALRYGIGVGRVGFTWKGVRKISAMKEWPSWTPPPQMLRRQPYLPRFMPGGPDNPLGARAIYLGDSLYRIHGSNEPETIGQAVSSGCFRMTNDDVKDLYGRVRIGTLVVVR
jgi:lipoprotein-anchoring transpeptidase ErfK/SrfK